MTETAESPRAGLVATGVSKTYGTGPAAVKALAGVSLSVRRGEMVALMGASGSGKSTLLHLAGGLDKPTTGFVMVDDTRLDVLSARQLAEFRRRRVGYVFQDYNLISSLTAEENVSLPLELDGGSTSVARRAARTALSQVGLEGLGDRFPDELSGGQRQRVAIARAVVGDRQLLLADEPTGALDSVTGDGIMKLLRSLGRGGLAVVLTRIRE